MITILHETPETGELSIIYPETTEFDLSPVFEKFTFCYFGKQYFT